LKKVSHRPYTKGNLLGNAQRCSPDVEPQVSYVQTHTLAGIVRPCPDCGSLWPDGTADGKIFFEARSKLVPGRILEFLHPDGSSDFHLLESFEDINGNCLTHANPNKWIRFRVDFPVFAFQAVRVAKPD
jgi:hypothetical protein